MLPLPGQRQAQRDYALLTLASALTHNSPSFHHEDNKSKASTFADVPGECSQNLRPPVTAPACSPKSNRSQNFHTADNWRGRASKCANYAFSNFISPPFVGGMLCQAACTQPRQEVQPGVHLAQCSNLVHIVQVAHNGHNSKASTCRCLYVLIL